MPRPESFDRELVYHPRKPRNSRELLGRRASTPQGVLNGLRSCSGVGRRAAESRETLSGSLGGAARFPIGDHASRSFRIQNATARYAATPADFSEVVARYRHSVT